MSLLENSWPSSPGPIPRYGPYSPSLASSGLRAIYFCKHDTEGMQLSLSGKETTLIIKQGIAAEKRYMRLDQ